MAVTAPTPPQAPVVPKVEMVPTHGGGQTVTSGSGNSGNTGADTGTAPAKNGQQNNTFGTKSSDNQQGKITDAEKTETPLKSQEQQGKNPSESAEIKDVSEVLQLPAASTASETQTQQGFQYPPAENHSVLGTYWPFILVFAAALIFFLYRNYQKSHTIEIKKPTTLRELLEQEELGSLKSELPKTEVGAENISEGYPIEAAQAVSRQRQSQSYGASMPEGNGASETPPSKPQVKKSDGHIEIRI